MKLYSGIKSILLELTHACNHRCVMCPQADSRVKMLDPTSVFELLDHLENLKDCTLSGGEALLWPGVDKLIDRLIAEHPDIRLSLITNSTLLKDRHFEIVEDGRFRKVNVSFNAAEEGTYAEIHGRDHFHKALKNVERLSEIRTKLKEEGKQPLYLTVSCVFSAQNAHTLEEYSRLFAGKVDEVVFQELGHYPQINDLYEKYEVTPKLWDEIAPTILRIKKEMEDKGTFFRVLSKHKLPLEALPEPELKPLDADTTASGERPKRKPIVCKQAMHELMINVNGNVTLGCCNSCNMIGTLGEDSLEEIANSPLIPRLEANIKRGNFEYCALLRLRHKCPCAVEMDRRRRQDKTVLVFYTKPLWPVQHGNQRRPISVMSWFKRQGYYIIFFMPGNENSPIEEQLLDGEPLFDEVHVINGKDWEGQTWDNSYIHERDARAEKALEFFKKNIWCGDAMRLAVNEVCRTVTPVAAVANYMFTAPAFQGIPDRTFRILDTHDMFSRQPELVEAKGVNAPLACTHETEAEALMGADVIMAIQQTECDLLQAIVPDRPVINVGMVDDNPVRSKALDKNTIMYVGSDNLPNQDGIPHFLENIWPLIRKEIPDAKFLIAGPIGNLVPDPPAGVEVLGYVKDIQDVYDRATLAINCTRVGTGIKVKSVEAVSKGKALVSWEAGLDGFSWEGGVPFIQPETDEEFSETVVKLLRDDELRTQLEENAFKYASYHFSSPVIFRELEEQMEQYLKKGLNEV